jgi:2,4-dienoyl-CoA reductase-like NADH-dependent reductase (Old Yellow Enzyme family)
MEHWVILDSIKKNKVIEEGYADLVAYGKPYISNQT